ncbi:MAG: hypothetical protein E6J34_13135 [Chloroflexi bacterium]|nr:MAG: hypothetical protein E6J34_13135 [Chloroflexota bacterium]
MIPSSTPFIAGYKDLRLFSKQGGMGLIYHGHDENTDEEVIIKLMDLPRDVQDYPTYLRRFTRETDVANLLAADHHQHEHVLAAIDHGDTLHPTDEHHAVPYLVYPYIAHGSLSNILSDKPWQNWSLLHIADIIIQAATGLFHLHKLRIVHQDVKPGNFLWSPTNTVQHSARRIHIWLIDFGTAEWEGETISPIGTEGYIAPEQALGHIECSADQYALAVMARLLLTGYQPPSTRHPTAPPLDMDLTQLNHKRLYAQELDHVMHKALAQDPDERFGSVLAFAQALQKAILQQEEQPPSGTHHTSFPASPLLRESFQSVDYQAPTERAPSIDLLPPPQKEANSSASYPLPPQQTPPLHTLPLPPESAPLSRHDIPIVMPPILSPVPHQPVNETLSLKSPAQRVPLHSTPSLPLFPLQKLFTVQLPNRPTTLSWSPDGTTVACTFHKDAPRLIYNNQRVETLSSFTYGHCACWSPDSRLLAISICNDDHPQGELRFWDRNSAREYYQPLQFQQSTPIYGLDWSRNNLFAIWLENELFIWDCATLSPHAQFPPSLFSLPLSSNMRCDRRSTLRWSPDGTWLAAGANNGTVTCWRPPHLFTRREKQSFPKSIASLSWSPDSTTLAVAFANKQVMCWNLHTDSIIWESLPERPTMLSISPQTAQLVAATGKGLYFSALGDAAPNACQAGQFHAAWSSTNKLATLDPHNDEVLVIWQG